MFGKNMKYMAFGMIFIFMFLFSQGFAWYYSGWAYRKPITITEQSGNTLTDYQVKIVVDTATLISQGKMNSDCSDIRFTDANDNPLNYWIESGCNSGNTIIWVKVPSIPASGQAIIYMYYGNSLATSESDWHTIFEDKTGTWSYDGTQFVTTDARIHELKLFNLKNFEVSFTWSYISSTGYCVFAHYYRDPDATWGEANYETYSHSGGDWSLWKDSFGSRIGAFDSAGYACGTSDELFKLKVYGSTHTQYGSTKCSAGCTITDSTHLNDGWFVLRFYANSGYTIKVSVKEIRFKVLDDNGNDVSPTYSIGAEETSSTNPPPQITISSPTNSTYYTTSITASFTVTDDSLYTTAGGDISLVAGWHFDEGSGTIASDFSGNGNDGTIYGATWSNGKYGKALEFDGVDDYVEVPDSPSFNFTSTNQMTVIAWVNLKNSGVAKGIVTQGDYNGWRLYVYTDDSIAFGIKATDGNYYVVSSNGITTYPYDDNWHLLVGTWDGTTLKIYLDGDLINTKNVGAVTIRDSPAPVLIGATWTGSIWTPIEWLTNGTIDEVRIYNRALSEEEIQKLYQMGLAKYHVKAYLDGNLIYDNSNYENNTQVSLNLTPYIDHDGSYNFTVFANDTDVNNPQISTKTIIFTVRTYPKFSNLVVYPESPQTYGITDIQFNITWEDELNNIENVWTEHNFTDNFVNYTMNNDTFTHYYYNLGFKPPAGLFVFKICAKDTYGNTNCTNLSTYLINPAPSELVIISSAGWTITEGTSTTLTADAVIPVSIFEINDISVSNPYTFTPSVGFYDVYAEIPDHRNYTPYNLSKTLVVNSLYSCTDDNTFAYEKNISLTSDIVVLDFSTLINAKIVKKDLSDVKVISNVSDVWRNGNKLIVNATGLSMITVDFGNYYANISYPENAIPSEATTINMTSYTQIKPAVFITLRDELTNEELYPPSSETYGIITCSYGENIFKIENDTTKVLVASRDYITKVGVRVKYSADAYYTRLRYFDTEKINFINVNMFVADAFKVALDRIDLIMADVNHYNSKLQVYRIVGNETQIITEGYFDASHMHSVYLIEDTDYRIRVIDPDGNIVEYGIINVVSPTQKTIGSASLNLNPSTKTISDVITLNAYNQNNTLYIDYIDKSGETESVKIKVYAENGTKVFENSYNVNEIHENIPVENISYRVEYEITHKTFKNITQDVFVYEPSPVNTGLNETYMNILVLAFLLFIAGLIARVNFISGAFLFASGLIFFKAINWLTLPLSSVVFILILIAIGIIIYIKEGGL